jgi:uncharacterized protein (TIGR00297 family)
MSDALRDLLLGLALGTILALVGRRIKFLSLDGAIGVILLMGAIFAAVGWVWGLPALVFLISMMLLARYRASFKRTLSDRFTEGSVRGLSHILARMGWAVALAAAYGLVYRSNGLLVAYAGAIAVATADGWATELGVLSPQPPRLITSGRPVSAGTAGGISVLGLVAGLGGSWLIGFVSLLGANMAAWLAEEDLPRTFLWLPLVALIGGMAGTLTDSLLGATAQAIYYCEKCERLTEQPTCTCGGTPQKIRGWTWLTNEGVNLIASIVGAAVAAGAAAWLARSPAGW